MLPDRASSSDHLLGRTLRPSPLSTSGVCQLTLVLVLATAFLTGRTAEAGEVLAAPVSITCNSFKRSSVFAAAPRNSIVVVPDIEVSSSSKAPPPYVSEASINWHALHLRPSKDFCTDLNTFPYALISVSPGTLGSSGKIVSDIWEASTVEKGGWIPIDTTLNMLQAPAKKDMDAKEILLNILPPNSRLIRVDVIPSFTTNPFFAAAEVAKIDPVTVGSWKDIIELDVSFYVYCAVLKLLSINLVEFLRGMNIDFRGAVRGNQLTVDVGKSLPVAGFRIICPTCNECISSLYGAPSCESSASIFDMDGKAHFFVSFVRFISHPHRQPSSLVNVQTVNRCIGLFLHLMPHMIRNASVHNERNERGNIDSERVPLKSFLIFFLAFPFLGWGIGWWKGFYGYPYGRWGYILATASFVIGVILCASSIDGLLTWSI